MDILYGQEKIILPENILEMLRNGIPKISNDRLKYLYSKIGFIVTFEGIKVVFNNYDINEVEDMNYIVTRYLSVDNMVSEKDLIHLKDFLCLSHLNKSSVFNPSLKDVFAKIPYDIIDEMDAFEFVEYPQTMDDLFRYREVANNNCCLTRVRAYKRK